MPEPTIDERFARFEAEVPGTFRPAPVAQLATRTGRRRARWFLLAGLFAALVAAPPSALAVAGRHDARPLPLPPRLVITTPSGPSPVFRPVQRQATQPGVNLGRPYLRFVQDAQHAWAFFESCPSPAPDQLNPDYSRCRYALGRTADGGVTWHRANLPDLAADAAPVNIYPLDPQTITLGNLGPGRSAAHSVYCG